MQINTLKFVLKIVFVASLLLVVAAGKATRTNNVVLAVKDLITLPLDTPPAGDLKYPISDEQDPRKKRKGLIDIGEPSNVKDSVIFDPISGKYIMYRKIGDQFYRYPMALSLEEYSKYDAEKNIKEYWKSKTIAEGLNNTSDKKKQQNDKPLLGINVDNKSFDRIFGGSSIDIRPQGSAEVTFGVTSSRTDNPSLGEKQRRFTNFDFKQRIQLNVLGSVGEKLKITTNYNTEATFDFENQVKLDYTGYEDEIIKKIEFGNVALPLSSSLISGSQTLFGAKAQLQFGRLTSTTVLSTQRGKKSEIEVAGGAQTSTFEIKADEYEVNKHYFLSNYFRGQYDRAMSSLPNVNSGINITRLEVWVTNTNNTVDNTRNILAFSDLGEDQAYYTAGTNAPDLLPNQYPSNKQNGLYNEFSTDPSVYGFNQATAVLSAKGLVPAVHYEKLESARLLDSTAYTVNRRLGFISLNQQPLNNDEVLAIAYEYTLDGQTYQVGQFSVDGFTAPNGLILKLLKPTITNPSLPLWDLMMKNVYSINAFQVNRDQFNLNVFYNNPKTGVDINYLPVQNLDKIPLLQVVNLDKLNPNNQAEPDGVFDFVDDANVKGGTINAKNGRIFFPVIEPFGNQLRDRMLAAGVSQAEIDEIVYQQLYDSTKIAAQQRPELNRFKLKGTYKSAGGAEIPLNALNVPKGSVSVTAGGQKLIENTDYTVDYNLGRVKIINQGYLESQTPIKISLESNSLFSVQQKTFIGQRFDYRVNKDFNLGATYLNLSERPITPKVNFNEEPINNTMFGFDGNYQTDAPWLTRFIDRLPFIQTKEPSSISVSGEYARLIPGHSRAIGKGGNSYIDDFEGSQSTIDLRAVQAWTLASVPQGQPDIFPEGSLTNNINYGFNRAQLAWYIVDNSVFYQNNSLKPANINNNIISDHRQRQILEQEVFPSRQLRPGTPSNISVFDLAYYPEERGPYNFNPSLNPDGKLQFPENSWAGIMRRITTTDFEANNIEFVQFWIMDPFNVDGGNTTGGSLYLNLGNISEDVLKDGRKAFENGLPKEVNDPNNLVDTTAWGVVPRKQSIVNAFAGIDGSNKFQDAGFDGLRTEQERAFFANYLNQVRPALSPAAFTAIQADPANDDYHYYRGGDYDGAGLDILQRYKRYNATEGNSPANADSPESYPTSATNTPTTEDVNLDNNLSESESYFQYEIKLTPATMVPGLNYITSVIETTPELRNGQIKPVKWYQFKIPVRSPNKTIGGINDYRSIRFVRLFMKGWAQPAVLRFARMEFIRGEWRKYNESLSDVVFDPGTTFDVSAVNLEENGSRLPINYVLPPDILREVDFSTTTQTQLNEQSLSFTTCDLLDSDARGTFRNVSFDVRSYKKLRMYVHAEQAPGASSTQKTGDASVFIRLGSDFDNNYYEYEIPATLTDISSNTNDPLAVWPTANNMEIDLDVLKAVKLERNAANFPITNDYKKMIDSRVRVTVKGNPVLNDLRTVMIGVRNPKGGDNPWDPNDDGSNRVCMEVWVNELRLTDFDEFGGWAAVARVNAKMADLGNVSVAANISTPGFGSIEKKLSERQRETKKGLDATTNLELGKFLPEKSGIKIPLYLGFSENVINPQFDPLNPDIEYNDIASDLSKEDKRKRLNISQTFNKRRSINFTNVRKERVVLPGATAGKERFTDIENFSLTYSYSENFSRDINTVYRNNKLYRGGLTYGFTNKPKVYTPFKDVEFLKSSKYLALFSDFNFYLAPRQLGFRTTIDRSYTESQIRNNIPGALEPIPTYTKTFNWQRQYDLSWDLTRALKFDFSANNAALIGEPQGRVNKEYKEEYQLVKDSVLKNIRSFGETTTYNHTSNFTYKLPFKKIPITEFIDASATYGATYDWQRAPLAQDTLGHTIQNSRTIALNNNFNMQSLYTKVPFLKRVIDKKNKAAQQNNAPKKPNANDLKKALADGKPAVADSTKTAKKKSGLTFVDQVASALMMVKTASFNISKTQGTLLPGFGKKSSVIGLDPGSEFAPGLGFAFGAQRDDYFDYAADRDWLVKEQELYQPATRTNTLSKNFRASLEPAKSLRIDLTATQESSESSNEFFRYNDSIGDWISQSKTMRGTYSTSVITLATAFNRDDKKTFANPVFAELIANRFILSGRVAELKGINSIVDSTGYYEGYSGASQDVVIPAFLAAYTGKDANKQSLNPFAQSTMPNWRITYDGLAKLPAFQKLFRSFTINHAYRSTYNVSYITNLQATDNGIAQRGGLYRDFIPEKQISSVSIAEQFSPLISFDATLKNSLIAKIEIKKDRAVNLSLANLQVTEVKGTEWVIGTGYRFKDIKLPIKIDNKEIKSDLNVRADISIRNNVTVIRKLEELINDPTTGRRVISIKTSADYVVSSKVTLRAFFDRTITKPVLSIPFPNYNTNAGISLRFTLQ